VLDDAGGRSAAQYQLHPVEDTLVDKGRVNALECFLPPFDPDDADIEGVVEDTRCGIDRQHLVPAIAQATLLHLGAQGPERVVPRGVQVEHLAHQRPLLGVDRLFPPLAPVEVSDGGGERIEALLQPAIEALEDFIAIVADGGRHEGCD
jgi:hypothetical protein